MHEALRFCQVINKWANAKAKTNYSPASAFCNIDMTAPSANCIEITLIAGKPATTP
jgi:hypothetical protein